MKVIIAGSRIITNYEVVEEAIRKSGFFITEVVSGTAKGVDQLGEKWANENGKMITRFPAEWARYGKSAGYKRNEQMAKYADALVAIWDGQSKGTMHMINLARAAGIKIYIHKLEILSEKT